MTILIAGLTLWCVVHFFPSLFQQQRSQLIERMGMGPYKGLFAILILTSVILIVLGWRSATPEYIYAPAAWSRHVTFTLVLITFILFAAAKHKTNIKRYLRHPQLTGLVIWSIGHLIANGDSRSIALFSTLGIWAVIEIVLINRREGAWVKPEPLPVKKDIITVVAGLVVYVVLMFLHPYFAGVALVHH